MNNLAVSGYLTHDPDLIYRDDRPICKMRLGVKNGKYEPTYIDVRAFDEQAYACAEYLHKGSRIAVDGRLAYEEWRSEDDSKRERYSVVGWIEFLDPPRRQSDSEPEPASPQLALVS